MVWASLIHNYSILLSTLSSVNRKRLWFFDANYALQICSSPLTVYLVVVSIYDLCGIKLVSTSGSNITAASPVPSEP